SLDARDFRDLLQTPRNALLPTGRIQRARGDAFDRAPTDEVVGERAPIDHRGDLPDRTRNPERARHPVDLGKGELEVALAGVLRPDAFLPFSQAMHLRTLFRGDR